MISSLGLVILNHIFGVKHPGNADSKQTCCNILANSSSNLISKSRNATQQDITGVKSLQNRTDLEIKQADKRGAVVAWRSYLNTEEALYNSPFLIFTNPFSPTYSPPTKIKLQPP